MERTIWRLITTCTVLALGCGLAFSQTRPAADPTPISANREYRLGPEDQVTVRVMDQESLSAGTVVEVEPNGEISLPVAGRIHATGLTMSELELEIANHLKHILRKPEVSVSISKYGSQPISVFGAVTTPGVRQIEGGKTLLEVISLAGGLRADAGSMIKITRRKEFGPIPLAGCEPDPSGMFTVAEVSVSSVMRAKIPANNILIQPYDVVTVPVADFVYILGAVRKPGAVPLGDRASLSVLQALSVAEGLERGAAPKHARIIQRDDSNAVQSEKLVDIRELLKGKRADIALGPNDILFIPTASGIGGATVHAVDIAASAGAMALAIRP